jgi:Na+-transporting methylmalonyl-CoA/oxaloacetate decarboxylase gamma subunit
MNFHPEEVMMLVLLVGVFSFLALIVSLRHKKDQLVHQERLAALDKGVPLPFEAARKRPDTPRVYLLRGLLWLFMGVGVSLSLISISISVSRPVSTTAKFYRANEFRASGASEEQVKQLVQELDKEHDGLPLGLATFGLIPMGVGLAYLIFYRKENEAAAREVAAHEGVRQRPGDVA